MWPAPAYIQFDKNKNELKQNIDTLRTKLLDEKIKMKLIMKQWNEERKQWNDEREQWSIQKKFYENQISLLSKLSLD